MGKSEYVIRRVFQIAVLYFIIGSVLFAMFRLSPGNPMSNFIAPGMSAQDLAQVRSQFGLNQPWYVQYYKWLINIATLDFGISYVRAEPVWSVISGRMVNTLLLMLPAVFLAYLCAVPFGAYLAWNRGSRREEIGVIISLISRSAPVFWTGLTALWLLTFHFSIFPTGGMVESSASYGSKFDMVLSVDFIRHLTLPVLIQTFYYFSLPALLMRNNMIEVMNEDFVDFADLKGVSDRKVMIKHAARNASLPIVTAFATGAAYAIGGSLVIETVFDWPGLGRQIVRAILQNDYPVAQGTFMILAVFVLVANLLADIAYSYLDPRVTYN